MTIDHYFIILYLQTALSAIVACFSLYQFKTRNTSSKLIGLLFLCSFLSNTVAYLVASFLNKNVNIVGSIYGLIALIVITVLYDYNTFAKYRKWFMIIALLFLIFGSMNLLFFQKDNGASYNKVAGSFITISYCLFYFYRLITELPSRQIHTLPMFWFTSAFLFYYSTAFFLFAFRDYLIIVLNDDLVTYWSFHNIVSILQHGIILIGLYYDTKHEMGAERVIY